MCRISLTLTIQCSMSSKTRACLRQSSETAAFSRPLCSRGWLKWQNKIQPSYLMKFQEVTPGFSSRLFHPPPVQMEITQDPPLQVSFTAVKWDHGAAPQVWDWDLCNPEQITSCRQGEHSTNTLFSKTSLFSVAESCCRGTLIRCGTQTSDTHLQLPKGYASQEHLSVGRLHYTTGRPTDSN